MSNYEEFNFNESKSALQSYSRKVKRCNLKYKELKKTADSLLKEAYKLADITEDIEMFADEHYVDPHGEYVGDTDRRRVLLRRYWNDSDTLTEIEDWTEWLIDMLKDEE